MPDRLPVLIPDSCDDCGLCCQGVGSPVMLYQSRPEWTGPHPHQPEGMPQHLIDEIDSHFQGLARGEEPQDGCLWYDAAAKQCRHYAWRPKVCRDYELGGPDCLKLRRPLVATSAADRAEPRNLP